MSEPSKSPGRGPGAGAGPGSRPGPEPRHAPTRGIPARSRHVATRSRVLALADSESYLKWCASLLDALPELDSALAVVRTPILPTEQQMRDALAGTSRAGKLPPVIERRRLRAFIEESGCDIVLAGSTGPVVQQIYGSAAALAQRPALVSGLPGVGLPATVKGQRYRSLGDAFLTHSHAEARAYERTTRALRLPADILLARLPMLASPQPPVQSTQADEVRTLVFAPQAKVPIRAQDRARVLRALSAWCEAAPGRTAVVKLRSMTGEQETHHEAHPYRDLHAALSARGEIVPEVRLGHGPLAEYLQPGAALVTVSSTAALEALDRGLPTLIISDFGVNSAMLNEAFAGSGMERTLAQLVAGDLPYPSRGWLADNYFHAPSPGLGEAFELLAHRARADQLPDLRRAARVQDLRRLRAELRTAAPDPLVGLYRTARGTLQQNLRRHAHRAP